MPDEQPLSLGNRLKRLRLHRGFNQKQLDEASGVNQGTISSIELGRQKTINSGAGDRRL